MKNVVENEANITKVEVIDHPSHYKGNGIEVIDVIEAFDLKFHLGNSIKYILRAGKKGDTITDLKKAAWYLERKIQTLEKEAKKLKRKRVSK